LRSPLLHPRNLARYEATVKLLDKAGISFEFLEAVGEAPLAQAMGLILLGDYVSFYLAMLNGVDPTPVDSIDFVKRYLALFPSTGG
jgi:glucose/mannose-6-phosphate isomerase